MEDKKNISNEQKNQTETNVSANDMPIKAIFSRYESPFLQLLAPFVAIRYSWLALDKINPLDFLKRGDKSRKAEVFQAEGKGLLNYCRNNFAALGIGSTILGIVGLYSRNTLHDIHSLYSEAVGYELGKKKEDVSYSDVFFKSNNSAVNKTCNAYVSRTLARVGTALTFFAPWHKLRGIHYEAPQYVANAEAGTGALGVELLAEGFWRDKSFFDVEQSLAEKAINHTANRTYEKIDATDIATLMMLQHTHLDKNYKWPQAGSQEGQNEKIVTERIADLMNQTYGNSPNIENANLTMGKLNYLIGFNLLDKYPESLAFVELANKSNDMKEVISTANEIKNGKSVLEAFEKYSLVEKAPQHIEEPVIASFEEAQSKFTDKIKAITKETPKQPRTHHDFAIKPTETQLGIA